MSNTLILHEDQLPQDPLWLHEQACPVIAFGERQDSGNADVWASDLKSAHALSVRAQTAPQTSLVLVQVLRATEQLPSELGLNVESLAYSTLQAGAEFKLWQQSFQPEPWPVCEGPALQLERIDDVVNVTLNRPSLRNSITVEMRDALVEAIELLQFDDTITAMNVRATGACFSVGGELREFGSFTDPATAHWVRSVQSPARLLSRYRHKITCYVHGACLGSGMELPAFASKVIAHPKTFFQLPELQLGLIPGAGGTVSLTHRIGRQKVAWLMFSGKRINAKTALQWGLVDSIAQ